MVDFSTWGVCNTTLEDAAVNETPLWKGYTFHEFGLILSAAFGMVAIIMSVYLMFMHALHYSRPEEQKHIIRILFMVPVYSLVSFLSFYYYQHTIYYEVLRDCYEAFAIASFFSLMCAFIAPDLHDQKEYFRGIRPKPWIWPLKWGKWSLFKTPPRSGLTWFNIMWFCVFQYCFIRVFMTIVAVVTQATDRYCIDSLSPAFAHVWVTCIEGAAVSVAMYAVVQFFIQTRGDIAEHKPGIKVLSIKLVIFFSFWQTLIIDFLVSSGTLKASATISIPDFRVGLPDVLLCIEMAFFSILHLFAYPWRVYDVKHSQRFTAESAPGFDTDPKTAYSGGFLGWRAFVDAYNFWDVIKATARGARWIFVGRKNREQDSSYKNSDLAHATALEDRDGNKVGGAKYTKIDDPLLPGGDASPVPAHTSEYKDDAPYGAGQAYGGRNQAYGVTHPSQRPPSRPSSRPGTSGGGSPPPPFAMGGAQNTAYGGAQGFESAAAHGGAYPGAHGQSAGVTMPDAGAWGAGGPPAGQRYPIDNRSWGGDDNRF